MQTYRYSFAALRCAPTTLRTDCHQQGAAKYVETDQDAMVQSSQIEDDAQRRINAAHLVEAEEPYALAKPAWVDR
jgi:hypothetical protein